MCFLSISTTNNIIKHQNGYYLNDFTMQNLMYNPQTKEVQFIDFEDLLSCYSTKDKFNEELMLEKYERIAKSFSNEEDKKQGKILKTQNFALFFYKILLRFGGYTSWNFISLQPLYYDFGHFW